MSKLINEGWQCAKCGRHFEESHGYPVACKECAPKHAGKKYGRRIIRTAEKKEL